MLQHHALLLHGDSLQNSAVPSMYTIQSADVVHYITSRFTIDEARELSKSAGTKPFEGEHKVFVIVAQEIAIEAQNALLKLFEEPGEHTLFYVVVLKTTFLLPTLRSRLHHEEVGDNTPVEQKNDSFTSFLSSPLKDRLAVIAEKTKIKDHVWIEDILRGSEDFTTKSRQNKELLLKDIIEVRSWIPNKGSSAKMLLEHIALLLP